MEMFLLGHLGNTSSNKNPVSPNSSSELSDLAIGHSWDSPRDTPSVVSQPCSNYSTSSQPRIPFVVSYPRIVVFPWWISDLRHYGRANEELKKMMVLSKKTSCQGAKLLFWFLKWTPKLTGDVDGRGQYRWLQSSSFTIVKQSPWRAQTCGTDASQAGIFLTSLRSFLPRSDQQTRMNISSVPTLNPKSFV